MVVFEEFTSTLYELVAKEKVLFVQWDPSEVDSTTLSKLQIKIFLSGIKTNSFSITINAQNALLFATILQKTIKLQNIPFVGHNWKFFFTFFKRITGKSLEIKNVIDLAWYESYCGKASSINNRNLQIRHFTEFLTDKKLFDIYRKIYQPIICVVLPAMESFGLVNENTGQFVFPNYHVEGQENGRLSCSCSYKRCYNPHSMSDDQKQFMQLNGKENRFLHFDYRNMEVVVLAVLSQDPNLINIVDDSDSLVYENIFKTVTGIQNHENARNLGKKLLLPVIYGQTDGGLANSLEISKEQAGIYIQKLRRTFAKSFDYVEQYQKTAQETGQVCDVFGRVRKINTGESIKARNFAIQSPAALVCLEALVNLHEQSNNLYEIVFHVHDGYCISGNSKNLHEAYAQARKALLQSSVYLHGAKFKVSAKVGVNLAKMATIGK